MLNKILSYLTPGLLVIILGVLLFSNHGVKLSGTTNYDQLDTTSGYSVSGTSIINSSGAFIGALNATALQLNSGTSFSKLNCATSTWNPGSIGTSTPNAAATSTDIALSGAVAGDMCLGSLTSATTSLARVSCDITGTATSTITVLNLTGSALDLATGTARVCYFGGF